jgi:hypothetical protein
LAKTLFLPHSRNWLGTIAFLTCAPSLPYPPLQPFSRSTAKSGENNGQFWIGSARQQQHIVILVMFSLVSQKVMPQPPSANKKKQYEIHEVLGTGSFGKVMVRARAPIGRPLSIFTP